MNEEENSVLSGNNQEKEDKRKSLPQIFKPGKSGNPAGRPKGRKSLTTLLKDELYKPAYDLKTNKPILIDGQPVTWADLLIKQSLYKGIIRGQKELHQMIYDRIEGKAMARIQLSDDTEKDEEFDQIKGMLGEITKMQNELAGKADKTSSTEERPVEEAG